MAAKKEPFRFEEIKNACDSKNKNFDAEWPKRQILLLASESSKTVFICLWITVEKWD